MNHMHNGEQVFNRTFKHAARSAGGRTELVRVYERSKAAALMPWACKLHPVGDGYMGFELWDDYRAFKDAEDAHCRSVALT